MNDQWSNNQNAKAEKVVVDATATQLNIDTGIDVLFSTTDLILPCLTDNERKFAPTVCNDTGAKIFET